MVYTEPCGYTGTLAIHPPVAAFTARNDLAELPSLNRFLDSFWERNLLPEEAVMDVSLAMEEMFANVVMHGFPDQAEHQILIRVWMEDDTVALSIEDDGVAFNPLEAPPVEISGPPEELKVGGLGIHLVRNVMEQVEYSRLGDRNRLVMKKRIPEPQ